MKKAVNTLNKMRGEMFHCKSIDFRYLLKLKKKIVGGIRGVIKSTLVFTLFQNPSLTLSVFFFRFSFSKS